MDDKKITLYLSRILSGHHIFLCGGRRLKMVYPNAQLKYEAELVALEEKEKNRFSDWIKQEEVERILISQGLWTQDSPKFMAEAEKKLEDLKVAIFSNYKNPAALKFHRRSIELHRKTELKLAMSKASIEAITLEGYIENIKNNYVLCKSIYDEDNKIFFSEGNNIELLDTIGSKISRATISATEFRAIARSPQWSYYWNSTDAGNLFGAPIIDWTDEQRTLAAFTRMYDGARQHPESPSDEIFDDDDAFDGWAISERRKYEKEKKKARAEKMLPGNLSNAGEVFVVAKTKEEADDIMSLNDYTGMATIKERSRAIQRSGSIRDQDLPDIQRDLIITQNEMMAQTLRKK